jgi:hypothetical protein
VAVSYSSSLAPSNSTDALFREWVSFIIDGLVAGGWVQTADTGQINVTTVTRPLAASTMQGYAVFRMDDDLQSTKPVFMRLDFGSGTGGANNPGMAVEIGTGSSGIGVITGSLQSLTMGAATAPRASSSSASSTGSTCHISATPGHAVIAMFVNANSALGFTYGIEREQDGAGDVANTGLYTLWSGGGGATLSMCEYLPFSGGPDTRGVSRLTHNVLPEAPNAFQVDVGLGIFFLFSGNGDDISITGGVGTITNPPTILPPSTLYLVTPDTEWTTDAIIAAYVNGNVVTFRRLQTWRANAPWGGNFGSTSLWGRYD